MIITKKSGINIEKAERPKGINSMFIFTPLLFIIYLNFNYYYLCFFNFYLLAYEKR